MEDQNLLSKNDKPPVIDAVRAIGLIKPRFNQNQQGFLPPQLEIKGTAFLLKEYRTIITCAHVIQDFINSPVEISGMLVMGRLEKYSAVSIDCIDFAHDLATLRFKKNPNITDEAFKTILDNEFLTGLEIVNQNSPVSTKVAYAGYPYGTQLLNQRHDPTYSNGVVGVELCKSVTRKEIRIMGPVVGGFSGSPIVVENDHRKVLGVVSNGPLKTNANIFMGISWEHVKAIAKLSQS